MSVYIRADSSLEMGSGHIMRCLTLADRLREEGAAVSFISRMLPGNSIALLEQGRHPVARLPFPGGTGAGNSPQLPAHGAWLGTDIATDAEETLEILRPAKRCDWLIVDHYALDVGWEKKMRPLAGKIMAIDDLADRRHDCDLLLDQNLFDDMQSRYAGLVPQRCRRFLGPRYALLRPEFLRARKEVPVRDGRVRRILVFFGGSDATNETEKALQALSRLSRPDLALDVVVGAGNPNGARIRELCRLLPDAAFHCQVDNMAQLMVRADLAVGAAGGTAWERCFLGLPALMVAVADNQYQPARAADRNGLAFLLGRQSEVSVESLAAALERVLSDPEALREMAGRCLSFMEKRDSPVHHEIMAGLWEGRYAAGGN